jgi:hypothetical protein
VKSAAVPKEEVKAKYCIGCGACTPNRKKKQKQVEAKNIRPKRKRPLNSTKQSPSKAKKVAKIHRNQPKRPWLSHLLCSISTVGIALPVVAVGSQVYCLLGGCSGQIWQQNGTMI